MLNHLVDGALSVPGEKGVYSFIAGEGQKLYFDVMSGSWLWSWSLKAPNGATVFNTDFSSDQGPLVISQGGVYTLTIDGYYSLTGNYQFQVTEIVEPPAIPIGNLDSRGTEFWLTFPGNYNAGWPPPASPTYLDMFIEAKETTKCTVAIPGSNWYRTVVVPAGEVVRIEVPTSTEIQDSDVVEHKGIRVTSEKEVSVYGLSLLQESTEAYLGLPTDALGTEYIVTSHEVIDFRGGTQFAVVGAHDGTTVNIVPSITTGSHTAGVPYTVALDEGDVYMLRDTTLGDDLTGTIITATYPVAVLSGCQMTFVPSDLYAANYLVEQLPPVSTWGKQFLTVPYKTRLHGDTFRFLAAEDGTTIRVNGVVVATLNRGHYYEQMIEGTAQIEADKPILAIQYSNGGAYDGIKGDPSMMVVPPFEQYMSEYSVSTPAALFDDNYINLVVPEAALNTVTLDGTLVNSAEFTEIGDSGFYAAQLDVGVGAHHLSAALPFGAFMYGFNDWDAYSYAGGTFLAPVTHVTQLNLLPETASIAIGTSQHFTAIATDGSGLPIIGARVDFLVAGAECTIRFCNHG